MARSLTPPATWLSLVGAMAASAVLDSPVPIGFGVGAAVLTAAYGWLSRRSASREAKAGRQGLEGLAPSQVAQVQALEDLKAKLLAAYRALPGGEVLVASSEHRLDALIDAFVRLLSSLNAYRTYLNADDRQAVEVELAALQAEVAREENAKLREVKERRVDILRQRRERFHQASESRELLSHQLATIEDVLRLAFEQSIAIRDPEVVTRQLDAVAKDVAVTQASAREMQQFLELDEAAGFRPEGVRVR